MNNTAQAGLEEDIFYYWE